MLWIALNLPQLPLDSILRLQPRDAAQLQAQAAAPVVVTHKKRVGWCSPAALDAGIRPGMSEANAWSMTAALQVHARDPERERQALQEAALWTLHFTPHVVLQTTTQTPGLLAEVGPSLRLFGGLAKLRAQLVRGIAELGLQAACAVAPTAAGAWLLAQAAGPAAAEAGAKAEAEATDPIVPSTADATRLLDALPLSVLESAQPHRETLAGIGCTTLGQLRRLPRAGLARRFGKGLLTEIDRAYGNLAEAHRWFEAPEAIDLKLELPARVEHADALLFAARRLLLQLTGWLTARHAAVAGITLWLHHEPRRKDERQSTPLTILLAAPSRDADHLGLLMRERLGQLVLRAPVIEIALVADRIIAQAAPNTELFPTLASDAENTGRLVERLQSRLGTEAVRCLAIRPDHRPERSHDSPILLQGRPAIRSRNAGMTPPPALAVPAMRPGWLLPQPLALLTRQHKPFYQSPLTLLAGPERIEAGWWDDALALRDYFIAENDRHVLLWIFRLRPDAQGREDGWFLHGFFA